MPQEGGVEGQKVGLRMWLWTNMTASRQEFDVKAFKFLEYDQKTSPSDT